MIASAQKHFDRVNSCTVDRSTVIGLRKLINASERKSAGWSIGATAAAVSMSELQEIENAVERKQPLVVGELHETGLTLLRGKRHAKRLERVADIIRDLQAFHLVRFDRIGRHGVHSVPVYRATAGGDRHFYFRNIPWQSGGNGPEIVGRDWTEEN